MVNTEEILNTMTISQDINNIYKSNTGINSTGNNNDVVADSCT